VKTTFVDTSYWIALLREKDALHEQAVAWQGRVSGRLITTEYVLVELADALCSPAVRAATKSAIELIQGSASIVVIPASSALMNEGLALFDSRRDKAWSLTDCISFVIMWRDGLDEALTSDHHFEQAGFRALLRV